MLSAGQLPQHREQQWIRRHAMPIRIAHQEHLPESPQPNGWGVVGASWEIEQSGEKDVL